MWHFLVHLRKILLANRIGNRKLARIVGDDIIVEKRFALLGKIKESKTKVKGEQRNVENSDVRLRLPTSTCPVWEVDVEVLVNRASQKPIVIGKGAETVKYVRKCAERELSDVFGVKVALEIWVRVEPNWMKNERLLAEMGYLGELV